MIQVKQPPNIKIKRVKGSAGAELRLIWNPDFAKRVNGKIEAAQKIIDLEVLRHSLAYMPHGNETGTGGLIKRSQDASAPLVGTGKIIYPGPESRLLYYGLVMEGETSKKAFANKNEKKVIRVPKQRLKYHGAPKRGSHWVIRSWKAHGKQIVDATQKAFDKG